MATTVGTGSGTLASLIPDLGDTANIQTALKQLYYGTTAGTLSQTTGIYGALYTLYTGDPTFSGNVTIGGTLTVNGGTTTINSTTITVDDILLELGAVSSPSNTTANGGGIKILDGSTGKTIIWDSTNSNWTTSENWNLATGKTLKINNVDIASGTGNALVLGANASTSLALGNTSGTTTINGTLTLNNPNKTMAHLMGYTSTATAAGTTILTNTSSYYQQFTGTSTQTVVLPVTSTLATGWTYHIVNNSTGNLTVNSSGGNLVITVIPGTTAMVTCIGTSLTTAADWESGLTDFSTYTGSGNVVMSTQPTLSSPTLTTPIISSITNTGTLTLPTTTGTLALNPTTTIGDIIYASATGTPGTLSKLAGNTAVQPSFLYSFGDGTNNTTTSFLTSTGTAGSVVLSISPTFTGTTIIPTITSAAASTTVSFYNTTWTTGTFNAFNAATTGTINIAPGTSFASATPATQSIINIGTGLNTSNTKTINIGAAGTGGTVAINIGSSTGTSNVTFNGGIKQNGIVSTGAAAPTIASATTIAPTTQISFVSGTTAIATITAPSPISTTGGTITLIPTGAWTTVTTGNVALATTAVVSKALIMVYDSTTAKWYPSY